MTDREATMIVTGFQHGILDEGDLLAIVNDYAAWLTESESYTAHEIRQQINDDWE